MSADVPLSNKKQRWLSTKVVTILKKLNCTDKVALEKSKALCYLLTGFFSPDKHGPQCGLNPQNHPLLPNYFASFFKTAISGLVTVGEELMPHQIVFTTACSILAKLWSLVLISFNVDTGHVVYWLFTQRIQSYKQLHFLAHNYTNSYLKLSEIWISDCFVIIITVMNNTFHSGARMEIFQERLCSVYSAYGIPCKWEAMMTGSLGLPL